MIVDMIGALAITKVPLLWGHAPLYPKEGGFWDFFHEGRLEVAMLCGSVFLLIVGAGALFVRRANEPVGRRAVSPVPLSSQYTAIPKVDSGTVTSDRERK